MTDAAQNAAKPPARSTIRWAHLIRSLSRISRQLRKFLAEQTSAQLLSDSEFLLLLGCEEAAEGGLSQNDLARWLGLSAGQVSGMVETLRRRGLLAKERCRDDRRRQLWTLTPEGRTMLQALARQLDHTLHDATAKWPTEHLQQVMVVLEGLASITGQIQGPASATDARKEAA